MNTKNEFSLVFTRNINDYGRKFIDECAETDIKDSVMYIQKLVEVYNNFKDIVDRCFENDLSFLLSIDKAFYHIVNENAFLLKYDNKNKNAEFFAKYADFILKKCSKIPESEIMEKISSLMAIFNFLTEKDIFLNFYIRYYAKRLINNTSVGEEYENELIGRLKYICGFDFTLKLEKMRKDMVISKEFTKSFRDQLLTKGIEKPNFSVNILTKFTWPYKQKIFCNFPSDLNLLWNEFEGHYTNFYNSRKLNILSDISWGEVQSNCFKKHHIFRCCIPQISILMIYNDKNETTFKEIKNILNSNDSDVKLIIGPLVKRKLLNISYEFDNTNITDDTIFTLNTNFLKNKTFIDMTKIDNATSTTNNSSSTIMNVEKERIYFLEAVIVRIMKARKELKHQQLVAETLCQVKYRFNPEIKQIKKCINNLIEKEYLKRKETDREVYQYLL
ncbi:Cullin 1a [Strongyloides ratti]|uniref:Cullin 1a n=1 Tax=Strongyloides ratti TaxID=34506 RepID=A0A090MXW6_STRRB|nr:Cullin 1a [Strongyloides ratti]CEF66149.1 Cullin 1a [Strongyloides ratti]